MLLPLAIVQAGAQLQQVDVVVGKGLTVKKGDLLTVDYVGTLLDGTEFDSSKKEGRVPFKFVIGTGKVIKGWDQGLMGMREGGTRRLTIPSELAYGDRQVGDLIPPKSTLLFEVELKKIERIEVKTSKRGNGPEAKAGDTVEVHYVGKLASGKVFDSSRARGETFPVQIGKTRLIEGFTQGLIGMRLGEIRMVTIPSGLGYGEREVGEIPSGSTLVFEIELVKLVPKP